jgi:thymidylate synthase (FAD)
MKYVKICVPDDFNYEDKIYLGNNEVKVWRPIYKNIFNAGFIGLIDFMGDDQTVVDSARMSYGRGTKRVQEDKNLIRYLIRNRHWTPIEMIEIMWHIKAPIFVFRQWHRHRMASINEYSARYSLLSDDVYIPPFDYIMPQSKSNKQGRQGKISDNNKNAVIMQMQHSYQDSIQAYKYLLGETSTPSSGLLKRKEFVEDFAIDKIRWLEKNNPDWKPENVTETMIDAKMIEIALANGVYLTDEHFMENGGLSREIARCVMPLGTYSEMYWKSDLRNTFNFLSLRCDPHAQQEIRDYANLMLEMIEPIAPICISAFIDYQMEGKTLSKMEIDIIRKLYKMNNNIDIDSFITETMKESGASKREINDFIKTLKD